MPYFSFAKTVSEWVFRKPATRKYPIEKRVPYEATRGHIAIDSNSCIYCGICQKRCPTDAIVVDKATKTWTINRLRCIQCSYCVEVCPKDCLTNVGTYSPSVCSKGVDSFTQEAKPPTPA